MNTLAGFQNDFARALLSPQPATALGSLTAQPGFAVYRNTVIKGCVDAIAANYPAVTRLVGEAWLRAAASVYVREALPGDPALIRSGSPRALRTGAATALSARRGAPRPSVARSSHRT
jgi:hypothetical protein